MTHGLNNSNMVTQNDLNDYSNEYLMENDNIKDVESENDENEIEEEDVTNYDSDTDNEEVTKKVLPERASRGKRYSQLIGEEEEKDAQFWGHNTWEEEENDSGWSSEDEKIELQVLGGYDSEDTEGSNIDDESDDGREEAEEEIERAEAEDYENDIIDNKRRKKNNKNSYINKGKYKDPSLFLKTAQKDMLKKLKNKLKKKETVKTEKKVSSSVIEPRTMSVRASTIKKKQNLEEIIRKREERNSSDIIKKRELVTEDDCTSYEYDLTKKKKRKKKVSSYTGYMTQEDRLKACKDIERINTESLSQLEAIEEHKRYLDNTSSSIRKQFQSGPLSIYITWSSYLLMDFERDKADEILKNDEYCREIILYTDGKIPTLLDQKRVSEVDVKNRLCCIYGTPARYLDPLTNKYYSNIEAFKIIRKDYYANSYREFINEMREVEELIKYNNISDNNIN